MMRGASGDECGNLVLGQEYNRPAEAGVLKKPRGSDFLRCNKSLINKKFKKLKITPTCFGSYAIHHQGVQSCA
jgi:hypothetical protein